MKKTLCFIVMLFCLFQTYGLNAQGYSTYYEQRKSFFESLPDTEGEIIFLGNSISDGCNWSELLNNPRAKNRGISGDNTGGILNRLDEVTSSRPAKIFLMIGVNDLARGVSEETILSNYRSILENIKKGSPKTKVYVQSILPVNADFGKFSGHVSKNKEIINLNEELNALAEEFKYVYLNLHASFVNEKGLLDPSFTNDGLHLLGAGYIHWKSLLGDYVN